MKTGTALAAILFASASFPLLAQQPSPAASQSAPPTQTAQPSSPAAQQTPAGAPPATQASPATSPATDPTASAPAVELSPVNGELVSKLDSKTAKTGDDVVVRTKSSVKTADGTEIPKGSKLMGHVIAAQASGGTTNSQLAIEFDHLELKGGQSLAVHSQIQSITPAEGAGSAGGASAMNAPPASSSASPAAGSQGTNGATSGQRASGGQTTGNATQSANNDPGAAPSGMPAAGTVVAKNGNIAIQTTSIPGVLLANNAPGQQDPRMAKASSILLGARRDIQLDGGTQMVVGVAAAGGGAQ